MFGEILVVVYLIAAIAVGVKVFTRTISWLPETDRVMYMVSLSIGFAWGFLTVVVAVVVEGVILYTVYSHLGLAAALAVLAITVGPIEEGAKLIPYVAKKNESELYRWNLTIKAALAFGVIEGIGYFLLLFFSGNPIGAFVRLIVIAFHVLWTAIALEEALRGDLLRGYLKASAVHSLYDAPAMLLLAGAGPLAGLIALVSLGALVYMYKASETSFRFAYEYAKRKIEEKRRAEAEITSLIEAGTISSP
ncbi:hypothetical protein [Thermococcus sp.]|uniref:hypothetical protein n=1 Tax=Thermococcus sp. TaxID=35749 RepID=UPI0026103BEF|nr:hypothetical protein [Thermococcus sp.]